MGKRKASTMEEEGVQENMEPSNIPDNKRLRNGKKRVDDEGGSDLLLEEMGVGLLPASSDSPLPQSTKQNVAHVLQAKDPNVGYREAVTDESNPGGRSVGPGGQTAWDHELNCSYLPVHRYDGSSSYLLPSETSSQKGLSGQTTYSLPMDLRSSGDYLPSKSRRQPKGTDIFNSMSEEVVLSVFRWLPKSTLARCARVCKRWLRLTADETLWRRLDLGLATVPPGVVGHVLARGCLVLRMARSSVTAPIFISPYTNKSTFPVSGLSRTSAKLQYLDLSMSNLEATCLANLLSSCHQLQNLALENCSLDISSVKAISANTGIKVLHLGGTTGLTAPLLSQLLTSCLQLQELNLGWTGLSEESVGVVVNNLRCGLQRLCFSGHRDTLLDHHINKLCERCPNLKELDVSDATKLSSAALTEIVDKLTILEVLSTSRCYNITPSSYLYLSSASSIRYLNLFGVLRDQAMEELTTRLEGIEINKFMFTSVARPTVGIKRTSIWNLRVRD